ncbi:MAG: amino acid ABC transporter permease [Clostridia bacterium]|nr:amino acid ABC transporter permease [Clostridia bacterium]
MWEAKWNAFIKTFIDSEGYVRVLTGLKNTALIAVIGLLIGIVIGTLIAIAAVTPKYKVAPRIFDGIGKVYVGFFRGTPMVVQLLLTYYVLLPLLGIKVDSLMVCIIVFGMNSGAYVSEIMRSGIQSVDGGQLEAARAVGLPYGTSMMKVVIPQAIKNILPTLGNEFITLIKETSVVSFVGALDLYTAFSYIGSNNYEFMVPYLVMAAIYLTLILVVTLLVRILERRMKKSDRRH